MRPVGYSAQSVRSEARKDRAGNWNKFCLEWCECEPWSIMTPWHDWCSRHSFQILSCKFSGNLKLWHLFCILYVGQAEHENEKYTQKEIHEKACSYLSWQTNLVWVFLSCHAGYHGWQMTIKTKTWEGEIKSRPGPFPMTGILSLLFVTNCSLCAALPPSLVPPPLTVQSRPSPPLWWLLLKPQTDCDYQDWKGQFMSQKMHWVSGRSPFHLSSF